MSTWVELLWNDWAKLCSWKIWNSLTSHWISFFSGDFSDGPKPKEIYTWFFFFSHFQANPLWISSDFSSFTCGLAEVLERLLEGSFKLSDGLVIESVLWVFLSHLPWWNASFIRGKWWRKSVLSQPTCNLLLIICETRERSTKGGNSGFSWLGTLYIFQPPHSSFLPASSPSPFVRPSGMS